MSITLSALLSSIPFSKKAQRLSLHVPLRNGVIEFRSSLLTRIKPIKFEETHKNCGFCGFSSNRKSGFIVRAENSENEDVGESSMPDRFRYLTKEAPDKPVRWPWFIALAFLLYAWRTVLWELSNWKKALGFVSRCLGFVSKGALALVYHLIGDQITGLIRAFESTIYSIRGFYSGVVSYAPLQELTTIIILASCMLAIAEATVPDSVDSQQYLLTAAGIMGFAAVRGYISELFFWFLLVGSFVFARFIRKRDYVSSALPAATVLAAVGEPWIRMLVMFSYASLAILHHSKMPLDKSVEETAGAVRKVPFPLVCAALAIGVRVAAKWAGYRHLTWMIV